MSSHQFESSFFSFECNLSTNISKTEHFSLFPLFTYTNPRFADDESLETFELEPVAFKVEDKFIASTAFTYLPTLKASEASASTSAQEEDCFATDQVLLVIALKKANAVVKLRDISSPLLKCLLDWVRFPDSKFEEMIISYTQFIRKESESDKESYQSFKRLSAAIARGEIEGVNSMEELGIRFSRENMTEASKILVSIAFSRINRRVNFSLC